MNDEQTLISMLTSHGAALYRIARVYAGADGEEEDLHQEMVLQLWRGLPSFRGEAAPGTWLYRVALNTALSWRRSTQRRARRHEQNPLRPAVTPAQTREQATILEEFLGSLATPDRSVLLLYMEGLSHREIADVTGAASGAVAVRLHRIKQTYTKRYVEG